MWMEDVQHTFSLCSSKFKLIYPVFFNISTNILYPLNKRKEKGYNYIFFIEQNNDTIIDFSSFVNT